MSKTTERKILTLPEVKRLLEAIEEEKLSQFQRRVIDYAMKFSKIGEEEAARLSSELKALGLSDLEVAQIVNCMPTSSEEVRVILLSERKFVGSSLLEEVCKVLEKYKR